MSGVQTVPNSLHSRGLLDAAQDRAAFARRIVLRRSSRSARSALPHRTRHTLSRSLQRAMRQDAEPAPFETVAQFEQLGDLGLRARVAARG